jgi:hypothetical protein
MWLTLKVDSRKKSWVIIEQIIPSPKTKKPETPAQAGQAFRALMSKMVEAARIALASKEAERQASTMRSLKFPQLSCDPLRKA